MIVNISEKHSTGDYGLVIQDKYLPNEQIAKAAEIGWDNYIMTKVGEKILYIDMSDLSKTHGLYYESAYAHCKDLKTGTVVTFIQNSMEEL
jgi:hypothetical protein